MPVLEDQTGRKLSIDEPPRRIISLVPSQTELLFDLGLDEEVIGITKFCVHPEKWFDTKTKVGGTKQIKINLIHQLQPDLIIANKEENVKEQIEELEKAYPVWVSDVHNLNDAGSMILDIGGIVNKKVQALKLVKEIEENFSRLPTPDSRLRTCYLIWRDPYMTVGGDSFINSMMEAAGFENVFKDKLRYPEVAIEELKTKNLKLLLLSSEPYPFRQKHIAELQNFLPGVKIILVDGEMFSWYGSRLKYTPAYLLSLNN